MLLARRFAHGSQYTAEVVLTANERLEAFTQIIGGAGIAEGVVACKVPVGILDGHKVTADAPSAAPEVVQQADVVLPCCCIKVTAAGSDLYFKSLLAEKCGRIEDKGAEIAVDQRQTAFTIRGLQFCENVTEPQKGQIFSASCIVSRQNF